MSQFSCLLSWILCSHLLYSVCAELQLAPLCTMFFFLFLLSVHNLTGEESHLMSDFVTIRFKNFEGSFVNTLTIPSSHALTFWWLVEPLSLLVAQLVLHFFALEKICSFMCQTCIMQKTCKIHLKPLARPLRRGPDSSQLNRFCSGGRNFRANSAKAETVA